MEQDSLFGASYDFRFLDKFLGNMVKDPIIAVTELIANAFDSGAQNVRIKWPTTKEMTNPKFEISDDGRGLTSEEFHQIWGKLNYDRLTHQGDTISVYDDDNNLLEVRHVYGKNGKGRLSCFCFNDQYLVKSVRNNKFFECTVSRSNTESTPFILTPSISKETNSKNGLSISTEIKNIHSLIEVDELRKEISARFISRPSFKIYINDLQLTLQDIPRDCITEKLISFKNHEIKLRLIDTNKTDKSTKQRGVAWWVLNRVVGDINWSFLKSFDEFDQRSSSAKKYNLIIEADCLHSLNLVLSDWSGFETQNKEWREFEEIMIPAIKDLVHQTTHKESEKKANKVLEAVKMNSKDLTYLSKSKLVNFVNETAHKCPNITDNVLFNISQILINLEKSSNKFNLLQKLASISTDDLDKLDCILDDWGIDMAKIILDEIEGRLKTITEFEERTKILGVKEVQELQTLFNNGLWMFGANFETIEFSSNKGMTSVLKDLFNLENAKGSKNRPDYVIRPDDSSTLSAHSRPKFDDETFDEIGVEQIIIIDLKTTGLSLGSDEKDQIWKYVKELEKKGAISKNTKVYGFILGDSIENGENSARKEWEENVVITPMLYSTLLSRAKNRMLKLSDKVSSAPILKRHIINEQQRLDEIYNQEFKLSSLEH